ncbi:MAG: metal-dependent transcriptional regulator [Bacteroidota bacterium]
MPTQTKENYLKAIYFLDQKDHKISITDLSKEMGVSTPTVNNMVKKLQSEGWVAYRKYKPLQLTAKGRKVAALIVRKHRLAEMFLSKIMGFGWEEVHDIAEDMEHIASEKLFDRMDELLGYPTIDPHGSPIPDKEGKVASRSYLKLSDTKEGQRVRLCALADSSTELLLFLNNKQIKLGTEIDVLKVEPFDKSLLVNYEQHPSVMLSHEVCRRLLVELVGAELVDK